MIKVTGTNHHYTEDKNYLTVGKTYEARIIDELCFDMIDDEGDFLFCLFNDCNHGYTYEVIS